MEPQRFISSDPVIPSTSREAYRYQVDSLLDVRDIPLRAMRDDTRNKLTELLDPPDKNDWRMFADWCGIAYTKAEYIETKVEKTRVVLRELQDIQPNATFGYVIEVLEGINRIDAREAIRQLLVADAQSFRNGESRPLSKKVPVMQQLAIEDMQGKLIYFDAFVSSHRDDKEFQETLIEHLEVQDEFKLCFPGRDLLPLEYHDMAKVIQRRCKRVIVVVSKAYLSDNDTLEELAAHLDTARQLAPAARRMVKVIPIIIEEGVKVPITLGPFIAADYTRKGHIKWFWTKLVTSLKQPLRQDPDRKYYEGPDVPHVKLYRPE